MRPWCLAVLIAGAAPAAENTAVVTARDLYQSGRYEEAKLEFEKLATACPGDAEALYYLGKITVLQGDYATAITYLERATALAPGQSDCFLWLGNACAWAASAAPVCDRPAYGRKCLAAYRKALDLDPANVPAHFSLMNFYRHVPAFFGGGLVRARAEADAIRRLDAARGARALAVLCMDEKKYGQAFANLTAILRQNPSDYAANCLLGELALASGEHLAEGETALRRCLELSPGENDVSHEAVRQHLRRMAGVNAAQGSRVAVLEPSNEPHGLSR